MNRKEFELQVQICQEPLRRFLRNLCRGDEALADDIAQEAFIKAFLHLNAFDGRSTFSTWLFRIAYHCFCDNRRALDRYHPASVEDLIVTAPERSDGAFDHQELYVALGLLNAKERTALLLFYMEEKSLKEIADITRMPINTVKAHLHRGKLHVSDHLKTIHYERG
ncbi:MAG TPA: RNA polymerase sigma factor [Bacteroidales bacterium]|nr:RNA polymerase sigma factor [Bacteroidales bacterium]